MLPDVYHDVVNTNPEKLSLIRHDPSGHAVTFTEQSAVPVLLLVCNMNALCANPCTAKAGTEGRMLASQAQALHSNASINIFKVIRSILTI